MTKNASFLDLETISTQIIRTDFCECFEIIPGDIPSLAAHKFGASLEASVYTAIFNMTKPRICLDVGSNVGVTALFFAKHCEQVYAFEPNSYVFPVLQRNAEQSGKGVVAFPFGLSDKASELTLHIHRNWNTGASSFVAENIKPVASKTMQLAPAKVEVGDEVKVKQQIQHVDFIKIDTEGFEAKVLLGLKECIIRDKPVVALEWNADSTREQFKEHELFQMLFSDYLYFGLGESWNKVLYPTVVSRIKRGILKNVLKTRRTQALQKFFPDGRYDLVFFIPERFGQVVEGFSFLATNYIPTVANAH